MDVYPEDMGLLGELGEAYLRAGKADRAAQIFKKMIETEARHRADSLK